MVEERNAILRNTQKSNEKHTQEQILEALLEIKENCRILRARMVSLESWMAALSKGKDLDESHTFAKDLAALKEAIEPTILIDHCK